jgi:hypothetical protein
MAEIFRRFQMIVQLELKAMSKEGMENPEETIKAALERSDILVESVEANPPLADITDEERFLLYRIMLQTADVVRACPDGIFTEEGDEERFRSLLDKIEDGV